MLAQGDKLQVGQAKDCHSATKRAVSDDDRVTNSAVLRYVSIQPGGTNSLLQVNGSE